MGHVRAPAARRLAGLGIAAAAATIAVIGVTASPAAAQAADPAEAAVHGTGNPHAIPGAYIVVLKDKTSARPADLAAEHGAKVKHTYSHALHGFAATMTEQAARRLAANPKVAFVEQDATVSLAATQTPVPSWGLDRADQRDLPLANSYSYPDGGGAGVTAYIIDTGIRTTHADFGGRAVWGTNTTGDGNNSDCNGHGTHVAGTVGGSQYGMAKQVRPVAVKVLDCGGSGSFSGVVAGIDWVTGNHAAGAPAVANMSLGAAGADAATETAVRNSIADGVTYAIAAGNDNADACNFTPARVAEAITVNASTNTDARASFSNFGTCTDIFAPGQAITSAWLTSDTATNTISGTSMATPHVAGAAALLLGDAPTLTPAQVRDQLVANATPNKITNPGTGSPNRLLFVAPPQASGPTVTNPGAKTGTVGSAASLQVSASGGSQPYTWTATGLPAGLSINSSSGLISGTPTAAGTFSVTVTARDTADLTGSASFTWTINTPPPAGCAATNSTDVQIPDLSTVESQVTIAGCAGGASATSTVEVHIVHTFRGDLVVSLIAPDGSPYVLSNRAGGSADNIDQTYTVNLSSEAANGTWRLRVQDAASGDTGFINSWTLNLSGGGASGCAPVTNGTDVTIPDLSTVESLVTVSGCAGNASATSTVEVHIVHTFRGDLVVSLIAPDGSPYVLSNRAGGSADNIDQTFTVNLSSEAANGVWRLRVQDAAAADTGFINSWTLDA